MVKILIPTTPERFQRLTSCLHYLYQNTDLASTPFQVVIYPNRAGGVVKPYRELLESFGDDLVVLLADDVIVGKGWLQALVDRYEEGHIVFADHGDKDELACFCLGRANLMLQYYSEEYIHNFADKEFTEVLKEKGLLKYVPESRVVNFGHMRDGVFQDATYDLQTESYAKDRNTYERRLKERKI